MENNATYGSNFWETLSDRRLQTVLLLGFSSGLPLLLTGSTLLAWYTVAGVSLIHIGLLSLLGQPYLLKFLWSPFLDRFTLPFLSRRRAWILVSQIALVMGLVVMAFSNPSIHPLFLASVALVVAFLSATQDIAIDAYRTEILDPHEFGLGASLNSLGYRLAMLVAGGIAMILADHIGWRATYLLMALLMSIHLIITYYAPPIKQELQPPLSLRDAIIKPFRVFLSRDAAWKLLAFIMLYRLTDAFATSLTPAFLLRTLHFSLTDVGAIYKSLGLIATLLGTFIGGIWTLKLTRYRALFIFGVLQAISVLFFMVLAMVGKNYGLMVLAITVEQFCNGLASVALVSFLMALCDLRYTATQFALFSAFAAVGRVFVGPIAALLVSYIGWAGFFFSTFLLSLPSLLLLRGLRRQITSRDI